MTRTFILTNVKRKILVAYLIHDKVLPGFRQLKAQIKNLNLQRIETDLKLIKELRARATHELV